MAPPSRPGYGDVTYSGGYSDRYSDNYDDGYDDDVETPKPGRGCLRVVVAAVLAVALLVGVTGWWVRKQIDPGGPLGDKVMIEVVQGDSTGEIGKKLEDADVITSSTVWTWYVRTKGGGNIQAGSYELRENMSMGAALDALEQDPLPPGTTRVTVPPGSTLRQTVAALTNPEKGVPGWTAANLEAALNDPARRLPIIPAEVTILEGTLFPETYEIGEGVTEADFVQRMVDEANDVFTETNLGAGIPIGDTTYSPYQVLVVASLVEEEIEIPEERAKLARLIYNRLDQDIALGIDATSCYGIAETPCNLNDDNRNNGFLDSASPYDTRVRKGLPQTPISSPSQASIEAALHPEEGDWIYSVLDPAVNPDGNHHLFTSSESEFEAAKQRCRDAGLGCG